MASDSSSAHTLQTITTQDRLEEADEFGERSEYWLKYDILADSKDKVMIERLNQNLDVLLIFAGLFSAVNTTFIVLTLASLNAPPSYRTDALLTLMLMQVSNSTLTQNDLNPSYTPTRASIRQNCMFFASLYTSILAAAGAVLAKQWLQSYERTEQTGSRRKQALLRTQKWMGAESWGLRPVVETLPTLLLISLALFFAALCDFLWSTSQPVALVAVAFTATGAAFHGFTVIAAAVDIFCPYQTAVSRVIRELALESRKLVPSTSFSWTDTAWRLQAHYPHVTETLERVDTATRQLWTFLRGDTLVHTVAKLGREAWMILAGDLLWRWAVRAGAKLAREEQRDPDPESTYAHSILWMLEDATEEEDILACAENVRTLKSLSSTRLVSDSPLFSTLVQRFDTALTDVCNVVEGSERSALVLARAVAHVTIADPTRWAEALTRVLNAGGFERITNLYERIWPGDLWVILASLAQSATSSDTFSIWKMSP
ncbi:hypothetical protein FRB95_004105 [Tulasnella sp. JGI-2019a]|nr:hypothetical protein FRB95_004105 [Tulasnella sp. JGI-2019a]